MKTTIKGNYSFRKASKQKISKAPAVIGLILIFISFVAGTQYFAWNVGQNRLPNEIFSYAGIKIYSPIEILEWLKLWKKTHRDMKDFTETLIVMGGCAFMGISLIAVTIRNRNVKQDAANLYGSAQYAELDEIRAKDGQQYYLRHNGKEHVIAFAPTRSGKGVGLVIPTLLSWEHSVVVLDIKSENWALTSGWRHQNGHKVLRWDPTDAIEGRSARYNPLAEIRIGTVYETGDVMNVATLLVDPACNLQSAERRPDRKFIRSPARTHRQRL